MVWMVVRTRVMMVVRLVGGEDDGDGGGKDCGWWLRW